MLTQWTNVRAELVIGVKYNFRSLINVHFSMLLKESVRFSTFGWFDSSPMDSAIILTFGSSIDVPSTNTSDDFLQQNNFRRILFSITSRKRTMNATIFIANNNISFWGRVRSSAGQTFWYTTNRKLNISVRTSRKSSPSFEVGIFFPSWPWNFS